MFLAILFLSALVGYGLCTGLNPVLVRFERLGEAHSLRSEDRLCIRKDSYYLLSEYPLAGTGLGTFGTAFRSHQEVALTKYVDHAHNDYLEIASDTGWMGLVLLFLQIFYLFGRMIVSFLNDSHRYRRSILLGCIGSTLALLIHSLTDFNLHIPANALIFAVILGIGYKAASIEPRAEKQDLAKPSYELL